MIFIITSFSNFFLTDVVKLHQQCFEKPWSRHSFKTLLDNPFIYGLLALSPKNNKLLGFILGQIVYEEAEILTLATNNKYRRQGIASALVQKFAKICIVKSCFNIRLEVNESNKIAINLYESNQFIIYGKRKKYYLSLSNNFNDALLLQLNLKEI